MCWLVRSFISLMPNTSLSCSSSIKISLAWDHELKEIKISHQRILFNNRLFTRMSFHQINYLDFTVTKVWIEHKNRECSLKAPQRERKKSTTCNKKFNKQRTKKKKSLWETTRIYQMKWIIHHDLIIFYHFEV